MKGMKYISEENLRKWILTENCNDGCGYIDERDLVDMEWEEEPFINKPCISTGVCHEDKVKVLEQIRDEIAELEIYYDNDYFSGNRDAMFMCNDVLQIIDKYKAGKEQ